MATMLAPDRNKDHYYTSSCSCTPCQTRAAVPPDYPCSTARTEEFVQLATGLASWSWNAPIRPVCRCMLLLNARVSVVRPGLGE